MTSMPSMPANGTTAMTMADLIRIVLDDSGLTETRRRNLASSIRRFCAALGVAPDEARAAFWFFRERLEGFHPADGDMTVHRWQTIRSDVAFALKRIGLAPDQPKPRVPLSEAWTGLRARMHEAGIRWALTRFAHFCDARGIPPSSVDDDAMTAYADYVRSQTFKTKPHRHLRDVCQLWNRLAGIAADLQLRPVTLPCNRETYTLPWEVLPASLRAEAEAWLTSLSVAGDLLSDTGPNRPLRAESIKTYRYALRQAVAGLHQSGRALEAIDSLCALVAPDAAKAALQFHIDRTGEKPSQMLAQIAHVLVLVAQHVGADDSRIEMLKK